jgi:hypothetical protein
MMGYRVNGEDRQRLHQYDLGTQARGGHFGCRERRPNGVDAADAADAKPSLSGYNLSRVSHKRADRSPVATG